MRKQGWAEELLKDDFSGFITFDNDLLMHRLYKEVDAVYDGDDLPKPFTMFYTKDFMDFDKRDVNYLDQIFYTIGKNIFEQGVRYPRTHIGFQGLYNAFEFILKQDPEFLDLVKDDKMYVPVEVMRSISEEMVYRLRTKARAQLSISKSPCL